MVMFKEIFPKNEIKKRKKENSLKQLAIRMIYKRVKHSLKERNHFVKVLTYM